MGVCGEAATDDTYKVSILDVWSTVVVFAGGSKANINPEGRARCSDDGLLLRPLRRHHTARATMICSKTDGESEQRNSGSVGNQGSTTTAVSTDDLLLVCTVTATTLRAFRSMRSVHEKSCSMASE